MSKDEDTCDDCSKMLCSYHRFSRLILQSRIETLRQKFIEICYDREFNSYNIIIFVTRMLREQTIQEKGKDFVNEICRFAMMGVRGKRMNKTYVSPTTITLFMKNAQLPFYLYKRHLKEEHFNLCLKNGFPLEESLNACYQKKEYKKIKTIARKITQRRNHYLHLLGEQNLPIKIAMTILDFLE